MIRIQELHRQAMDLAETALMAKHKGELEKAQDLFRQAFEKEKNQLIFSKKIIRMNRLALFFIVARPL